MATLPPWSDSLSDGCSVPRWLRLAVQLETIAQISVCRAHDEAYYYGGTKADRLEADRRFRAGLVAAGMSRTRALAYYLAVRAGGGPGARVPGVSWGFGGERFRYA